LTLLSVRLSTSPHDGYFEAWWLFDEAVELGALSGRLH
jgi:hypothetical protein